jgi:hypothetical protein
MICRHQRPQPLISHRCASPGRYIQAGAAQVKHQARLDASPDHDLDLTTGAPAVVILAGMEVTGLGWGGTRTGRSAELAH